jgi:hypothetical protein
MLFAVIVKSQRWYFVNQFASVAEAEMLLENISHAKPELS